MGAYHQNIRNLSVADCIQIISLYFLHKPPLPWQKFYIKGYLCGSENHQHKQSGLSIHHRRFVTNNRINELQHDRDKHERQRRTQHVKNCKRQVVPDMVKTLELYNFPSIHNTNLPLKQTIEPSGFSATPSHYRHHHDCRPPSRNSIVRVNT